MLLMLAATNLFGTVSKDHPYKKTTKNKVAKNFFKNLDWLKNGKKDTISFHVFISKIIKELTIFLSVGVSPQNSKSTKWFVGLVGQSGGR